MEYSSMRLSVQILLVITILLSDVFAVKMKLRSGVVFTGEIVAENNNFYTLSIDGSSVHVLKSMIVEMNDAAYPPIVQANQSHDSANINRSKNNNISRTDSISTISGECLIKLNNGNVFKGEILSESDKIVVLEVNGSSINIFKKTISEIIKYDQKTPAAAQIKDANADIQARKQTEQNATDSHYPDSSNHSQKRFNNKSNIESDLIINDTLGKLSENNTQKSVRMNRSPSFIKIEQKNPDTTAALLQTASGKQLAGSASPDSDHKIISPNVDKVKYSNASKSFNDSLVLIVKKIAVAQESSRPSVNKIAPPVAPTLAVKTDSLQDQTGKIIGNPRFLTKATISAEIVLKNGTKFNGKIVSENDSTLLFESDGATITFEKKLIKSINGKSYTSNRKSMPQDSLKNNKSKHIPAIKKTDDVLVNRNRFIPSVEIPSGIELSQLTDSLKSSNCQSRAQAARLLASTGQWGNEAVEPLKNILGDTCGASVLEPIWIDSISGAPLMAPGAEAARALALIGEAGITMLTDASKNPNPLIRRRAAFGLCENLSNSGTNILLQLLHDSDSKVRAVTIGGLRYSADYKVLMKMSNDADMYVRANVAFLIGQLRVTDGFGRLIELLKDKKPLVRERAAEAIGKLKISDAVGFLIAALHDDNERVRFNIVVALGEYRDSILVNPLIALLHDNSSFVQIAAIEALQKIRDPKSIPVLYSLLQGNNEKVRNSAAIALRMHTNLTELMDALDDNSLIVKENASYLLWLMTGQDYGVNKADWLAWYSTTNGNPSNTTKNSVNNKVSGKE
jgi:HEAT repeat protein/sRNA-binding regulator protein Hfq